MRAVLALVLLLVSTASQAGLVSRLDGLAYYDDVLHITWLTDANLAASNTFGLPTGVSLGPHPSDSSGVDGIVNADGSMNWPGALHWIDAMNAAGYLGFDDWRLPTVSPVDGITFNLNFSNNGTTDSGYADSLGWVDASGNPVSEMGHMYYVNLGNLGVCTPNGGGAPDSCVPQDGAGLVNTGPFENIIASVYWTGRELPEDLAKAWTFGFGGGDQVAPVKSLLRFGWAVRSGDVAVIPIPAAVWLFGSALAVLGWMSRRAG